MSQASIPKLQTPIMYLKGVGPQKAETLAKELGIFTYADLLEHYPFRYYDRTKFYKIAEVQSEEMYIQVKGIITNIQIINTGKKRLQVTLTDETGSIDLIWFQGISWIQKTLISKQEYIIFGRPNFFNGKFNFSHPEIELALTREASAQVFQPVYSTTEKLKNKGLDSKGLGRITKHLIAELKASDLADFMPAYIIEKYKMLSLYEALLNIHYPQNETILQRAIARIKFDELFLVQLKILQVKVERDTVYKGIIFEKLGTNFNTFYKEKLPFQLTEAQQRVLKEIRKDTLSGKQMNRLLQGDVGSGKTIVALITCLIALDNNYQAAVMAPTEILAQQHFESFSLALGDMPLRVRLLTGSVKGKKRKEILEALAAGEIDILIGTHALIEDTVQFKNLGMVVIDEQHRFGVGQRAKLWSKNTLPPHVLVMTATPIPRTLAMTIYGDLEVSVIDQLPPGRKPIQTLHKYDSQRMAVFGFIRKEIEKSRQIYIVYPLIDESEKMDFKDLMDGFESISREFPRPQYQISIVHGKMKAADKEYEMARFIRNETQIMVATTVIEVGVNVPNASVMIIESAERFGLSQLHQLRGRVGRGADQSYCILMSGNKLGAESRQRLKIMCDTNDGFEISEFDLKLRGPGDIQGTQQSGVMNLKLADLSKDKQILILARETAQELLLNDALMQKEIHQSLKLHLSNNVKNKTLWSRIS
ncbi:MAG: ATP-dependent DNA helicase RecG [Bacteroidota bacterium]